MYALLKCEIDVEMYVSGDVAPLIRCSQERERKKPSKPIPQMIKMMRRMFIVFFIKKVFQKVKARPLLRVLPLEKGMIGYITSTTLMLQQKLFLPDILRKRSLHTFQ